MKKNALWIRLLLTVLTIALLATAFSACSNEEETQSPAQTTSAPSDGAYDENGYLKDKLPESLTFGWEQFNILGCESQKDQYYATEEETDPIPKSIFETNATVEARLQLDLNWDLQPGRWNGTELQDFTNRIVSQIKAGEPYDACCCYNLLPYRLATQGYCENLYGQDLIDYDAPWWPETYLKTVLYKDQLYGLMPGHSIGAITKMSAVYFNDQLIENYHLENPYDLVDNKEWTLAKLQEMIKDTGSDNDGQPGKTPGDFYGLLAFGSQPKSEGWLFGMDQRFSHLDGNGELVLDFDDPRLTDYFYVMQLFLNSKDVYKVDTGYGQMFWEERAIFYMAALDLTNRLKDKDISYGVVPIPMYDEYQTRYYTHLANMHDVWCISTGGVDVERSTAFLECLASEDYRQAGPMYFEVTLKARYAHDPRVEDMYDLILENVDFDFAQIHILNIAETVSITGIIQRILVNDGNWTNEWKKNGDVVKTLWKEILKYYDEHQPQ